MKGNTPLRFKPASKGNCRPSAPVGLQGFEALTPPRQRFQFSDGPTAYQKKETAKRKRILEEFGDLLSAGLTRGDAARKLRVSLTSLWRWQQRIMPGTDRCGRKSDYTKLFVPPGIVAAVQKLRAAGMGSDAAWRAVAKSAVCPRPLAIFIKSKRSLPPSFGKAGRVTVRNYQTIEGIGFSFTTQLQNI
jgi:hypothetical protein